MKAKSQCFSTKLLKYSKIWHKKKKTKQKIKKLKNCIRPKINSSFSRPETHFKSIFKQASWADPYSADGEQSELLHELLQPTSFLMNKVTMVVAMATNKSWSLGCLCASLCCHGDGYKDSNKRST